MYAFHMHNAHASDTTSIFFVAYIIISPMAGISLQFLYASDRTNLFIDMVSAVCHVYSTHHPSTSCFRDQSTLAKMISADVTNTNSETANK